MRTKYHVGDVIPRGDFVTNPYSGGYGPVGETRRELLVKFKAGEPTPGWNWWYAPAHGGAHRITRDDVDWETSGV